MRFTLFLLALALVAVSAAPPASTSHCATCKSVFANGAIPKTNFVSAFNGISSTTTAADASIVVGSFPANVNNTLSSATFTVPSATWMELDLGFDKDGKTLINFDNVEAFGTAYGNKGKTTGGQEVIFVKDDKKPSHYGFAFYGYNTLTDFSSTGGPAKATGYGFGLTIADEDIKKVAADGLLSITTNLIDAAEGGIWKNCWTCIDKNCFGSNSFLKNNYATSGSNGAFYTTSVKPPPCTVNCTTPTPPPGPVPTVTRSCNFTDISSANKEGKTAKVLFTNDPTTGSLPPWNSFSLSVWSGSVGNAAFPVQYQTLYSPTLSSSASSIFVTIAVAFAFVLALITPKMF